MTHVGGGPVVPMPVPLGRSMRMGPFPSGRAALTFVGYVGAAVALATVVSPLAGLPLLGAGFLLTAYAPDGRPLDEHAVQFVRWQRRRRGRAGRSRRARRTSGGGGVAVLPDGRRLAALACGGLPVAFLPPEAAHRLFDAYRSVLRGLDGPLFLRVGVEPLSDRPFRLPPLAPDGPKAADDAARAGYDELVRLLCRRRRRRVVDVVLIDADPSSSGRSRLEARVRGLADALRGLGLVPERRVGRSLSLAITRMGWQLERVE